MVDLSLGTLVPDSTESEQIVYVKDSLLDIGIGTVAATRLWESDPGEYGDFAHLARTDDGQLFFSITDMENHHGAYLSVRVSLSDLDTLAVALRGDES